MCELAHISQVLLWDPSGNNIGHCALQLSDGTYISFWPEVQYTRRDYVKKLPVKSKWSTYKQDKCAENDNGPDHKIVIENSMLSNERIRDWWLNNQYQDYCLHSNHCADVVYKAIKIGLNEGFDDKLDDIESAIKDWKDRVQSHITGDVMWFKGPSTQKLCKT
ncbi:unnamed protein product [Oppiella nova]|uniref:Uncharacterized protein n=1 Tax=Oppiella nova TaxID=334625 RepID=A0A7R9M5Y4_9ACAR|nr:unnamed protein product [Oppiella nova]CAG2171373.1 unnamed protein product [Oppiella nova]